MKQLLLIASLVICSISAFAQFPLGSDRAKIKAYFAANVPYATVQEFKTGNGNTALCFTKVKVVGDYTFYFDYAGLCSSYIVTYDKSELADVTKRFDNQFCHVKNTKWESEDSTFDVIMVPPKKGENFFSIVYQPLRSFTFPSNSFASN